MRQDCGSTDPGGRAHFPANGLQRCRGWRFRARRACKHRPCRSLGENLCDRHTRHSGRGGRNLRLGFKGHSLTRAHTAQHDDKERPQTQHHFSGGRSVGVKFPQNFAKMK